MNKLIIISTGTYNTQDYRERRYKLTYWALKYARSVGYGLDELVNGFEWSHQGKNYRMSWS